MLLANNIYLRGGVMHAGDGRGLHYYTPAVRFMYVRRNNNAVPITMILCTRDLIRLIVMMRLITHLLLVFNLQSHAYPSTYTCMLEETNTGFSTIG